MALADYFQDRVENVGGKLKVPETKRFTGLSGYKKLLEEKLDAVAIEVKPDQVKLARQVIGMFEGDLDLSTFRDEYREGLRRVIDAKIAGEDVVAPDIEAPPRVVNLMEALKKSLDTVTSEKKKPAKAAVARPAPAAAKPVARRKRA